MEVELLIVENRGRKGRHRARAPANRSGDDSRRFACQRRSIDAVNTSAPPRTAGCVTRRAVRHGTACRPPSDRRRSSGITARLLADVIGHGSHLGEGENVCEARHMAGSNFHCGDHIAGVDAPLGCSVPRCRQHQKHPRLLCRGIWHISRRRLLAHSGVRPAPARPEADSRSSVRWGRSLHSRPQMSCRQLARRDLANEHNQKDNTSS